MPGFPEAQVLSIDREPGLARYDVWCPYCSAVHHHQWSGTDTRFAVTAPCSGAQRYRVDLRTVLVQRPKCNVSGPHPVFHGASGRDDNAMHEYENNWIE